MIDNALSYFAPRADDIDTFEVSHPLLILMKTKTDDSVKVES